MLFRVPHIFKRTSRERLVARSYEAAGGGRRWHGSRAFGPPPAASLAGAAAIRSRARYAHANNSYIAAGVSSIVTAIVGAGIKPSAKVQDRALKASINAAFEAWTDEADATGGADFYALQGDMVRSMVVDGEALAIMETDQDTGALTLRQIPAEQLDASITRELPGGARIVAGVELAANGRPAAYHILPDTPGLPFVTIKTAERVPARDVVHLFRRDFAGQLRGVSWLAPVLLRLAEIDKTEDALTLRTQISAMLAGFVTDLEGGTGGFDGKAAHGALEGGLEPGTMKFLGPGQDVRFSDPNAVGEETVSFLTMQLHAIASGLGCTYEQLTSNYTDTNYSSSRASLVEFRARMEGYQHNLVAFQFCRPIYRRWITLEALSGRLSLPGFTRDARPYLSATWVPSGWSWVDPAADVKALREAEEAGFMSRREIVQGRGRDIEELDAERAADGRPESEAA